MHPDHFDPFHFHVSHCHTSNAQWRPSDRVALLENRGMSSSTTAAAANSGSSSRNPIALKSRNGAAGTAASVSLGFSSIDLFHNGGGSAKALEQAGPKQTSSSRNSPLRKKNGRAEGKTEAISGGKTTSSSSTAASTSSKVRVYDWPRTHISRPTFMMTYRIGVDSATAITAFWPLMSRNQRSLLSQRPRGVVVTFYHGPRTGLPRWSSSASSNAFGSVTMLRAYRPKGREGQSAGNKWDGSAGLCKWI